MRTRIRVPETDARAMLRTVKSPDVPCTPSSADSQVAKRRPSRSSSRSASAAGGMSSVPIASAIAARTVQQPFDSRAEGMVADMPRCPNASHVSPRPKRADKRVVGGPMAKYVPNDHGKVVDGNVVVFFQTPPADQAPSSARLSPAERAETARLQAAALTAAAQKGVPFCAECEQARRELEK